MKLTKKLTGLLIGSLLIISIAFNFFIEDLHFKIAFINVAFHFCVSMLVGFGLAKFKGDIERYWMKYWLNLYVIVITANVLTFLL